MKAERKMCKCEYCGVNFSEGTGIDHELNESEVVEFCTMDHFKAWIDNHMERNAN